MIAPHSYSGFYRTTVLKCCLAITMTCSFIFSMPFYKRKSIFTYNLNYIFNDGQVWRLISSKIAFEPKDMVFGGLLMYYFRIFERRFGPRKFISYILCTGMVSTLLELLAVLIFRRFNFDFQILPSGPYSIIFPFFIPYFTTIPRVACTYILGIPITGKLIPYLFGIQIASTSLESLLVCSCGLAAGIIYKYNIFWMADWIICPRIFVNIVGKFLGPYLDSPPPKVITKPLGATLEYQRQDYMDQLEENSLNRHLPNNNGDVSYQHRNGNLNRFL